MDKIRIERAWGSPLEASRAGPAHSDEKQSPTKEIHSHFYFTCIGYRYHTSPATFDISEIFLLQSNLWQPSHSPLLPHWEKTVDGGAHALGP
jgi:hypothetical protein